MTINRQAIEEHLRKNLPGLQTIYAFGNQIAGTAGPDSDLDLALLDT